MTELTQYRCDKCRIIFDSKEKALECEKHHTLPKSVFVKSNYRSVIDEKRGCPEIVLVEMEDGRIVEYGFREVLPGDRFSRKENYRGG